MLILITAQIKRHLLLFVPVLGMFMDWAASSESSQSE